VHGFLVDSRLWDGVAHRLAAAGIRSYLVDWPLGSHRTPMRRDADLTPTGVARMINEVLDALGLEHVTLVGNDTGGAICQLLLADDPQRVGQVVLTNCDAFENFPPKMFVPLFLAAQRPALTKILLTPMRLRLLRHSPLAFGLLLRRPRDPN
jgi:pimeloyl-ACP methyl ester carboxylesterase